MGLLKKDNANAKYANNRFKSKGKRKVKPLEMYTRQLQRRLLANSPSQDLSIPGSSMMRLMYDKILTHSHIRKYYYLTGITNYMPKDLIAILRQMESCEVTVKNKFGNDDKINAIVFLNFKFIFTPHIIDWTSKEMRVRTNAWERDIKEGSENIERHNLVSEQEMAFDRQSKWLKDSWLYWRESGGRGCATPVMSCIIELCAPRSSSSANIDLAVLKNAENQLFAICVANGIEIKAVKGNLWDFSLYNSSVSAGNPMLDEEMPKFPITDEIFTEFTEYSPGKLTDTEVPLGFDIDTGKVVYKNFVGKFGEAESIVIAGITGSGKSFMAKSLVINMLLAGYSVVVMDRDGEYIPAAELFDGIVISMSAGSGLYYDSTEIGRLTGDPKVDNGLLDESTTTTMSIFEALVDNHDDYLTNQQRAIINDAYNNMFKAHNIVRTDKTTWHNSCNLSYHELYKHIKLLKEDTDYYATHKNDCDYLIDTLRIYFEPDGIYSYLFKKRISITEIQDKLDHGTPFVVLHMDLKDEGNSTSMDKPTVLKLITTSYLSNMILLYNKSKKRFTFDIIEEWQRYLNNVFAKGMTVTKFTGNRKRNAISVMVTNNPGELATNLADDPSLKAISSNITTSIIGKINKKDDIKPICDNLNLSNCESCFKSMLDDPTLYKHVFVARMDGQEAAMIKAVVPPSLLETPIFITRDTSKAS